MKVQLTLGERINIPVLKSVYSVVITYEHGDGDSSSTAEYIFDKEEDYYCLSVHELILLFTELFNLGYNEKAKLLSKRDRLEEWLEQNGYNNPETVIDEFFNYDVCYNNCFANMIKLELFWHDCDGIKYNVSYTIEE